MRKLYLIIFALLISIGIYQAQADTLKIKVSPNNIDFHVKDMNGRISGYTDTQLLLQIPYLDVYRSGESIEQDDPPKPYQLWNELYTSHSKSQIMPGKHQLIVYSGNITTETEIRMDISIYWINGVSVMAATVSRADYIFPGSVYIYEFDIPITPPANNELTFIKVSNPSDLIIDINTLAKAGYIGNQHFVSELIKDINEIEAEKAKGKIDDGVTPAQKAKKEYQELLKELNEKWAKREKDEFVDPFALNLLERDITYIINHIQ